MHKENKPERQENESSTTGNSTEVVVKTEGDKSLRLNVTPKGENCWEVTIPFDQPILLSYHGGQWVVNSGAHIREEFIKEIGTAIESGFAVD